jgi:hypothetical protein
MERLFSTRLWEQRWAEYDRDMNIRITALDIKVAAARQEFMRIADSDIQSGDREPMLRWTPSEDAMAVYDEVIRQEEVQADLESE